jgi:predicted RNase H-like nuclease (RuvC/YqgF family)
VSNTTLLSSTVNRGWRGGLLSVALTLALGSACSTPAFAEETRVERLVRQLGAENFDERDKALKELIEIGAPALEALQKAAASPDAEVAMRAKACIPEIERNDKVVQFLTFQARLGYVALLERQLNYLERTKGRWDRATRRVRDELERCRRTVTDQDLFVISLPELQSRVTELELRLAHAREARPDIPNSLLMMDVRKELARTRAVLQQRTRYP